MPSLKRKHACPDDYPPRSVNFIGDKFGMPTVTTSKRTRKLKEREPTKALTASKKPEKVVEAAAGIAETVSEGETKQDLSTGTPQTGSLQTRTEEDQPSSTTNQDNGTTETSKKAEEMDEAGGMQMTLRIPIDALPDHVRETLLAYERSGPPKSAISADRNETRIVAIPGGQSHTLRDTREKNVLEVVNEYALGIIGQQESEAEKQVVRHARPGPDAISDARAASVKKKSDARTSQKAKTTLPSAHATSTLNNARRLPRSYPHTLTATIRDSTLGKRVYSQPHLENNEEKSSLSIGMAGSDLSSVATLASSYLSQTPPGKDDITPAKAPKDEAPISPEEMFTAALIKAAANLRKQPGRRSSTRQNKKDKKKHGPEQDLAEDMQDLAIEEESAADADVSAQEQSNDQHGPEEVDDVKKIGENIVPSQAGIVEGKKLSIQGESLDGKTLPIKSDLPVTRYGTELLNGTKSMIERSAASGRIQRVASKNTFADDKKQTDEDDVHIEGGLVSDVEAVEGKKMPVLVRPSNEEETLDVEEPFAGSQPARKSKHNKSAKTRHQHTKRARAKAEKEEKETESAPANGVSRDAAKSYLVSLPVGHTKKPSYASVLVKAAPSEPVCLDHTAPSGQTGDAHSVESPAAKALPKQGSIETAPYYGAGTGIGIEVQEGDVLDELANLSTNKDGSDTRDSQSHVVERLLDAANTVDQSADVAGGDSKLKTATVTGIKKGGYMTSGSDEQVTIPATDLRGNMPPHVKVPVSTMGMNENMTEQSILDSTMKIGEEIITRFSLHESLQEMMNEFSIQATATPKDSPDTMSSWLHTPQHSNKSSVEDFHTPQERLERPQDQSPSFKTTPLGKQEHAKLYLEEDIGV